MTDKRKWLIVQSLGPIINGNLIELTQEQSPGISGGTTARRLLTEREAYDACSRLANNAKHILNGVTCRWHPVEIHHEFWLKEEVKYTLQDSDV